MSIAIKSPSQNTTIKSICIAVFAMLTVLYFFSPSYVLWRALNADIPVALAEVYRAEWTLKQLSDPFISIDDETNAVIRWRLLFPIFGNLLSLSPKMFLALPWIGCLICLVAIARSLLNSNESIAVAYQLTTILASSAWFFVSTGWLAYFDAWIIFGLVVALTSTNLWSLFLCAFALPWVDERFIIGLPIALVARTCIALTAPAGAILNLLIALKQLRPIVLVLALGILPYIAIRLFAYISGKDAASDSYVKVHLNLLDSPSILRLHGAWEGVRIGWVAIGYLLYHSARYQGAARTTALAGAGAGTLIVCQLLAADVARSTSILVPVALAGLLCWLPIRSKGQDWLITLGFSASLLIPASHVVLTFDESPPIYYLPVQLDMLSSPPAVVDPNVYYQNGLVEMQDKRFSEAEKSLSAAIGLAPNSALPLLQRGAVRYQLGNKPAALEDLRSGLHYGQTDPEVQELRHHAERMIRELESGGSP